MKSEYQEYCEMLDGMGLILNKTIIDKLKIKLGRIVAEIREEEKQALENIAYLIRMKRMITAGIEASKLKDELKSVCFNPAIPDDENQELLFSDTKSILLSLIVKGEIDPREIAWSELRNRGLDAEGKWVGFGEGRCEKPFTTKEKVYY
jgi:hypothetical protein